MSDDDADEQEEDHAEPLGWFADRERVARFGEEEVVEEEGGDGRGDGPDRATDQRGRHDGRKVDGGRVGDVRGTLDEGDRQAGQNE